MTPRLVGLGNLILDDVVFPDGTTRMGAPGGAVLYAALGASLWGLPFGAVSIHGEDYPLAVLEALRERGVELAGLRRTQGPTLRTWLLYEGRLRRVVHRLDGPSHGEVSPRAADVPPAWASAPAFHLSPMPFEVQREAVASLADGARLLSLDPYLLVTAETFESWRGLASQVDVFLASEDEMLVPGAREDPRRLLTEVSGGRLRYALFKRGERGGVLYLARERRFLEWAPRVSQVVDPTGAGDAFAAGFLAGLLREEPVERALQRAVVGASYAIEGWGPEGLLAASPEAAEARLREWFGA